MFLFCAQLISSSTNCASLKSPCDLLLGQNESYSPSTRFSLILHSTTLNFPTIEDQSNTHNTTPAKTNIFESLNSPTNSDSFPNPPLPFRATLQPHCRHRILPEIYTLLHFEQHNIPICPRKEDKFAMAANRRPSHWLRSLR